MVICTNLNITSYTSEVEQNDWLDNGAIHYNYIESVNPVNIDIKSAIDNNIKISTSSSGSANIAASAWSSNYDALTNKPRINGNILEGDQTPEDLGIIEDKTYFHKQTIASDT